MESHDLTKMIKVEVVVTGSDAPTICQLFEVSGARGYTSLSGVSGLGHHGHHQGRLLFNDQSTLQLLITIVSRDKIDALLDGLRSFFEESPGVMFVSETYVSRPEYFS